MAPMSNMGLTKEQVRRIVLSKLRIVYRDWHLDKGPFWNRQPAPGRRRTDPAQSFESALVAALLGGLSEAIEKNNRALVAVLGRKDQRVSRKGRTKRRKR